MKIHILGTSESYVITLAQLLANRLNLKYLDSNDYFWEKTEPPFAQRRNPAARNQLLTQDLATARHWILCGPIMDWGDHLFPDFDLIIFLYVSRKMNPAGRKRPTSGQPSASLDLHEMNVKTLNAFLAWSSHYDFEVEHQIKPAPQTWWRPSQRSRLEIVGNRTLPELLELILPRLQRLGAPGDRAGNGSGFSSTGKLCAGG